MPKKLLKQLIDLSFVNNKLNQKRVERIVRLLSRNELKFYLKGLKKRERELSVFIDNAMKTVGIDEMFKSIFPNRKIVVNINPSLLLGLRITDNDNVFELSLKNSLDKITSYLEE